MTTLTIHVPNKKASLIKRLLKELDVIIETEEDCDLKHTPNNATIKAMNELKTDKGTVFNSAKDLFASI